MKKVIHALAAIGLLTSATARAQQDLTDERAIPPQGMPAPDETAPAPPEDPGQPEDPGAAAPAPQEDTTPAATGQWTYTSQYGWVWLPYGQNYTYVADDGGIAYQYAYYPTTGWSWVEAPWVLGLGPSPYWGHSGYSHFAWYSHPWFHSGVYRGAYVATYGTRELVHGATPVQSASRQAHHTSAPPLSAPVSTGGTTVHSTTSHSGGGHHGGRR